MGLFVRAFTRRNIVAIAVGVLVAATPLVVFNFWLSGVIDRQGQGEIEASARRIVALAESRVVQSIGALDELAVAGIVECGPDAIKAMQRAAFLTTPIKEVALLDAGGETLCTEYGAAFGPRRAVSSELLDGAYSIDVVELADGQKMVRLRRPASSGSKQYAALVPAALFLPQVTVHGDPFAAFARIETRGAAAISEIGARLGAKGNETFATTLQSERFGFRVEVATPRGHVIADQTDLKWLGLFFTTLAVMVLIGFALLIPKRPPNNPVSEMQRALAAGEFVPYYQPIVDIQSGQLRGAEVLVRWRKPDGTLVSPGAFIPLAESSGLIKPMTYDLMRRVVAQAGDAIGKRPALKVSFNFAGMLFADQAIVKDVRKIFAKSAIKFSQVVLEVTERDPIENFTVTRQIIAALQGLGIRIAIDDVGTGHSGLSYMLKLGVDIIKIDKMFVDAIGTDRNSTTIVETLIDLAHNMRMDVVAEGVENFEQVMHLRELGIRSAQGYVFAPPLPGEAFLKLVEAMDTLTAEKAEPVAPMRVAVAAA